MNLQSIPSRFVQAWRRPPTGRRFAAAASALVGYVVLDNIGATIVAGLSGYNGNIGQLFTLSMTPGYSPATAASVLTTLGSAGRHADATVLAVFDLLFPIVYAIALSIGLRLVLTRNGLPRLAAVAGLIPFVAVVANWLADVAIIAMTGALSPGAGGTGGGRFCAHHAKAHRDPPQCRGDLCRRRRRGNAARNLHEVTRSGVATAGRGDRVDADRGRRVRPHPLQCHLPRRGDDAAWVQRPHDAGQRPQPHR